jgi:hypothetical protein
VADEKDTLGLLRIQGDIVKLRDSLDDLQEQIDELKDRQRQILVSMAGNNGMGDRPTFERLIDLVKKEKLNG